MRRALFRISSLANWSGKKAGLNRPLFPLRVRAASREINAGNWISSFLSFSLGDRACLFSL